MRPAVSEPLLMPLLAVASGILLGQAFDFNVLESAVAGISCGALAFLPMETRWVRWTAAGLAFLFAGAFLLAWHRPTQEPYIDSEPREVMLVEGCVVSPTALSGDGAEFTLELEPGARALVRLPNYDPGAEVAQLDYGQRVEIEARIRPPHNFTNPGSFDYATYLARRDIFWTALVPTGGTVRILEGECGSRLEAAVFAIRIAALQRIRSLFPNAGTSERDRFASAMLEAVLIGENGRMEDLWSDEFRQSGTYHALVISGLHVSVLAGLLLFLFRFVPVSPATALGITAIAAWSYALISGFAPPVVRAAAGFTLFLCARLVFRRTRLLNLLAAIALVYLILDPYQLLEASFQLSFLAVAAIGAFAAPLLERTTGPLSFGCRSITHEEIDPHLEPRVAAFRVEIRLAAETLALLLRVPFRWAARTIAGSLRLGLFVVDLLSISAAIQIGLALPMVLYFHRISFTGLSANLAMIPLMNLIVPGGFLALFTGWDGMVTLEATLLEGARWIASFHAELDPGWRIPDPPAWLAVAYIAALLGSAVLIRRHRLHGTAKLAVVGLLAILIWSPWPALRQPGTLELTAIDVGQGDSLLVVFPEGSTMLIDGGGRPDYRAEDPNAPQTSGLDLGEDVVSPYLWSRGIQRLDIVAATHAHADHTGGLAAVLENFRPRQFWVGANPPEGLIAQAQRLGIETMQQTAADPYHFSGAEVEILAPVAGYSYTRAGNNDSLVVRLSHGQRSFLLAGDLESVMERRLVNDGRILHADVLKVGHHGSRTSTTEPFLDAVSPSFAMISAGFANSYGHPHPDVMGRLAQHRTATLRTDLGGRVSIYTDGAEIWFDAEAAYGMANTGEDRRFSGFSSGLLPTFPQP